MLAARTDSIEDCNSLSTDGEAKGGVLNVAAGENLSISEQSGSNPEMRIGAIC